MTSGRPSVPRSVAGWGTAAVAFVARHSVLLALAVLAVVGLAVLDDYGVLWDGDREYRNGVAWNVGSQRGRGQAAIAYALGDTETLRDTGPLHNRYYGVVFEVPLVLVERLLGLTDSRAIYLSRHLLTHLCFLAGGGGAAWLAARLFGSRWLALLALGLFVLHPRLYAHSFFNAKDIPFLVAFLGCLGLIHRAWQRGGVGAYALCGVGVGVATNLRIMGGGLFVAVVVMRVVDWGWAGSRAERRQVGRTLGVFGLASVLTLYAVSPYLWGNPLELLDAIAVLSQHPRRPPMLFQGEVIRWPDLPAHYIPTWLAITTPPGVLLLSLIGAAGVLWRTLTHPGELLRNPTTRFEGLLVACVLLPVGAVIVLNANVYDGWRHMYFLYAPLCLLAVAGLRRLVGVCRWPALRAGVYGLAVAGLAGVVIEMVGLHPYQHLYFNRLAATAERYRQLYRATTAGPPLLRSEFDLYLDGATLGWAKAPCRVDDVRGRFVVYVLPVDPAAAADRPGWRPGLGIEILHFDFFDYGVHFDGTCLLRPPLPPYAIQTLEARLVAPDGVDRWHVALAWSAAGVRATDLLEARYRAVVAAPPVARSAFALYLEGRTLTYVKAGCQPADTQGRFFLEVFPRDRAVLAAARRSLGFAVLDFGFDWWRHDISHVQQAAWFADKCLATVRLPAYPLARLRTGQVAEAGGGWAVDVALPERSGAERPLPGVSQ